MLIRWLGQNVRGIIVANQETLVIGGDGFCGWPTSLYLSEQGHHVTIVDNLSRRRIDEELEVESLTPIFGIKERIEAWSEIAGNDKKIDYINLDVAKDVDNLDQLIGDIKPDNIVHFGEQRSAPYSMKNNRTARYTMFNNVIGTHNLLLAVNENSPNSHIVHLGTMGVYGYGWEGDAPIAEGYVKVTMETPDGKLEREIVHPPNAGSWYHNTKVLDQDNFQFSAKNDRLRITDLHQGIVWGTETDQTLLDPRLTNRFDYDGDYGTVLNRFLMQAAIGYPLTVHGTGGQTRAFINIKDTARCVWLATENPPKAGDRPTIRNQVTEKHRVIELANKVAEITATEVAIVPVKNPRKEAESNELNVDHKSFDNLFEHLGMDPVLLDDGILLEVENIAVKNQQRVDYSKIPATSLWVKR